MRHNFSPTRSVIIHYITLHYAAQFFPYQECNYTQHNVPAFGGNFPLQKIPTIRYFWMLYCFSIEAYTLVQCVW